MPAEIVFINGAKAGAPGNCSALVFLRWADAPETVSGIGHFQFNAAPATKVLTPPFDDTGEWVIPYAVAPGYHWVMLSKSWVAGPVPDDCSSFRASQQATYTGPASVDLTVDVPKSQTAACTTAKAAAVVTRTKVAAARKALANATTKVRKAKARAALTRATNRHAAAVKKVKSSC